MANRPTERPHAERNAPRPRGGPRRRRPDLWAPVRVALAVSAAAWPARWVLDSAAGPDFLPWAVGVWGLVWCIAALVIRRHVRHAQERHVAGLVLATAGVWVHAVWWAWGTWGVLMAWLGVGVVIGWGAQLLNEREWERGRVRDDLAAWPDLMTGTVWADVFPLGGPERIAPGVVRRRFRRKENATTSIKDLTDDRARTRYEERHHLDDGSVRVERDGRSVDDVVVTEVRADPHAGFRGVEWTGRPLDHVWDELVVGYYEDDQPELYKPWRPGVGPRHGLIAGITGSGKSTLMRLLACAIAPAAEAVTHMIDCKGGQSFGRIAALFSWFTYDAEAAVKHLEALVALMRERQLEEGPWKGAGCWYPSPDHPVHFVFIDELARLVGLQAPNGPLQRRALAALVQLVQEGRSTGFCLIAATQFPTVDAVGSTQFRSQIDWRVCFRMSEPGQDDQVLTNKPKGVDASKIDEARNGTAYVQNSSRCRPVTLRCLNVPEGLDEHGLPDPDVPDIVTPVLRAWWRSTDRIPPEEETVLDYDGAWSARTLYAFDRETYVVDPFPDDPPAPDEPGDAPITLTTRQEQPPMNAAAEAQSLTAVLDAHTPTADEAAADDEAAARQERPADDDDTLPARAAAWRLLLAAGGDGLSPLDVYSHPTVTRSSSWGYKRFAEWRDSGDLVQVREGVHRVADHHLR